MSLDPEPDVAAVALAGVGQVDEDVGLRVELHGRVRPGRSKSMRWPRRRSAGRCRRARSRRRAPGRRRRCRRAAGRCRLEDAGAVGLLDLVAGAQVDGDASRCRRAASRWASIRPAGPAPTMPTWVRVTVGDMPPSVRRPSRRGERRTSTERNPGLAGSVRRHRGCDVRGRDGRHGPRRHTPQESNHEHHPDSGGQRRPHHPRPQPLAGRPLLGRRRPRRLRPRRPRRGDPDPVEDRRRSASPTPR